MTLSAGTRLGSYEIVAPLGAGGMGEVFRARDVRLDRDVAIKVLPDDLFGDAERVGRFEREAKALAALNHPGIAAIYAFEEIDGRHLLVQELLEGETLRQALSSAKPPLRRTLDWAVQISKALAAAHEKGVVHRDLKPENLFVTNDGRVKILDFGLAKLSAPETASGATNLPTISKGTEPGVVLGTLGYMSPEQVRGRPADARSDIFSFGALLYEMLSGKKAFAGDSAADTMSAILREDPPDLAVTNASIPPGLERIVRHCLEKSPEQRFHSAHDIAFALEALSNVSTPRAAPSALHGARWPLSRVLVACVVLALAGLAAWLAVRPKPNEPVRFRRLTFRRGRIDAARFAADGHTVVYSAAWEGAGKPQLFSTRVESPESLRLSLPERTIRSISRSGEMLLIDRVLESGTHAARGTLSSAPIAGSGVRELMEDVADVDWAPDGASFAVVRAPGWNYRLELPAGKTLAETHGWFSSPRVSPAGDLVAFADHPVFGDDRGMVSIVDRSGKKRVLTREFESVQGVSWSKTGDEIWFAGAAAGNERALQAVTPKGRLRFLLTTPAGMYLQDVSKDGRVLFVEPQVSPHLVALVDGKEHDVGALDWPVRPILSRDGKTLVFTEEADGGGPGYAVYLRRLEPDPAGGAGLAPAIRLGKGEAVALSPDGRWILAWVVGSTPLKLQLLPTGAGEPRALLSDAISRSARDAFAFFPDGRRILFSGSEAGKKRRSYVQDLDGGPARPFTSEGVVAALLAPDGRGAVVIGEDERLAFQPVDGGGARPVAGAERGDVPLAWAEDGRTLFLRDASTQPPARIYRLDAATGRRELVREFLPADRAGLRFLDAQTISADGRVAIFHTRTIISTLYLAEGVR